MRQYLIELLGDLLGRFEGPMNFRLYVQPLIAIALAIRDGRKDALAGRAAYAWAVFHDPAHRAYLLQDGWRGVSRVFVLAYVLDIVYQYVALHAFRPPEALLTALVLALLPYVLLRGPVNRLMRGRRPAAEPH
jgi:hypothetical protein